MKSTKHLLYLYLLAPISIFFLWDINYKINYLDFSISPKYFILILIFPILIRLIKKNNLLNIDYIFNKQRNLIYLVIFISLHFFLVNYFKNNSIEIVELMKLLLLILLAIIYSHFRHFFKRYLKEILIIFFLMLITFSIIEQNNDFNVGECNNKFFLINYFNQFLSKQLTNSFFVENSHLAITIIPSFIATIIFLTKSKKVNLSLPHPKKNKILLIFLLLISIVISFLNFSTTFFVIYILSILFLFIFFYKKISLKFWIITLSFLIINILIFLSDENCIKKINQMNLKHISEGVLIKDNVKITHEKNRTIRTHGEKNLTTLVYERGIILSIDTLMKNPLGWGYDGMDEATINLVDSKKIYQGNIQKPQAPMLLLLNLNDGLANSFKVFNEFGIFSLILVYYFIRYILKIKKVHAYHIFIIVLFISLGVRGAGYFNAGFIFCVFEFFYLNKFFQSKESPSKYDVSQ